MEKNAALFLKTLYDKDHYGTEYFDGYQIGSELGFERAETDKILIFLIRSKYLSVIGDNWRQIQRADVLLKEKGLEIARTLTESEKQIPKENNKAEISAPIIFISHITEDREIAVILKYILSNGLGKERVKIFVSSDNESIKSGFWFDQISYNIQNCAVAIILCSPYSIKRPWIPFETGAITYRLIEQAKSSHLPIFPLCYGGLDRSKLPSPLNNFQAWNLLDYDQISEIMQDIAEILSLPIESTYSWTDEFQSLQEKNLHLHEPPMIVMAGDQSVEPGSTLLFSGTCPPSQMAKISIHCINHFLDIKSFYKPLMSEEISIESDGTYGHKISIPKCLTEGNYYAKIETTKELWAIVQFVIKKQISVIS